MGDARRNPGIKANPTLRGPGKEGRGAISKRKSFHGAAYVRNTTLIKQNNVTRRSL